MRVLSACTLICLGFVPSLTDVIGVVLGIRSLGETVSEMGSVSDSVGQFVALLKSFREARAVGDKFCLIPLEPSTHTLYSYKHTTSL